MEPCWTPSRHLLRPQQPAVTGSWTVKKFNEEQCKLNPTFQFWSSYTDAINIMLRFLRATREGNWKLHLATVRDMLPWFFALDRVNYARYLTLYYHEMISLPDTHPDTHEHLQNGECCVQRQSVWRFSKVACDQCIEQTINRDTKSKAGWTGFHYEQMCYQSVDLGKPWS